MSSGAIGSPMKVSLIESDSLYRTSLLQARRSPDVQCASKALLRRCPEQPGWTLLCQHLASSQYDKRISIITRRGYDLPAIRRHLIELLTEGRLCSLSETARNDFVLPPLSYSHRSSRRSANREHDNRPKESAEDHTPHVKLMVHTVLSSWMCVSLSIILQHHHEPRVAALTANSGTAAGRDLACNNGVRLSIDAQLGPGVAVAWGDWFGRLCAFVLCSMPIHG